MFGVAGTSTFKSPPRKDLFSSALQVPGPGNYLQEAHLSSLVVSDKGKKNQAFGVKEKRFRPDDTEVPGPGQYVVPSTVVIKEGTR